MTAHCFRSHNMGADSGYRDTGSVSICLTKPSNEDKRGYNVDLAVGSGLAGRRIEGDGSRRPMRLYLQVLGLRARLRGMSCIPIVGREGRYQAESGMGGHQGCKSGKTNESKWSGSKITWIGPKLD